VSDPDHPANAEPATPAESVAGAADVEPASPAPARTAADPSLPGPYPVGRYAAGLRDFLRGRPRVLIQGEVTNLRQTSGANVYFELRDADGGIRCAIWRNELERLRLPEGALRDGVEVVLAGGPDYYPGSRQSSPSFSFRASWLRLAGEGDLLARLAELRRRLEGEGLFEPQKQLSRPVLPKVLGVVTAESGAARRDLLAGLERRGWRGTVVWGFASVQDRRAAPAITRALQDLAAIDEMEAIVVCRGGGSLADLWAFCDETLCRTVAMLRVPVISAVGHERDRTLIDDVAAVSCSTPTHAAEAAVGLDCGVARRELAGRGGALRRAAEMATGARARHLAGLARGPGRAVERERAGLEQKTREIRAAAERGLAERERYRRRIAVTVLARAGQRALGRLGEHREAVGRDAAALRRAAERAGVGRREDLARATVALRAHDPDRTLERGFALVRGADGEPLVGADAVRAAGRFTVQLADGEVAARVDEPAPRGADRENAGHDG